jgi:hypothetical protein
MRFQRFVSYDLFLEFNYYWPELGTVVLGAIGVGEFVPEILPDGALEDVPGWMEWVRARLPAPADHPASRNRDGIRPT